MIERGFKFAVISGEGQTEYSLYDDRTKNAESAKTCTGREGWARCDHRAENSSRVDIRLLART